MLIFRANIGFFKVKIVTFYAGQNFQRNCKNVDFNVKMLSFSEKIVKMMLLMSKFECQIQLFQFIGKKKTISLLIR